jgi:ribosome assembly protein 4
VIDNLEADIIIDVVSKTVFHALPSGYCKSVLTGHAEAVLCCKFDPSGALLASGSGDGMLIVWDPMSGTPIKKFKCSSQWVQCLAWSGDGRYLAVGAVNGMLHLLEIEKWSFVQLKTNSSKPITCLAWNHDNLLLAVSSDDGVVRLFELPSLFAKLAFSAHDSTVTSLQFTPEGYLYSTSRDCFIKYWDPSFSLVHRLKPHSHWVNYMLSSKQHLYTCSDDGTVCMVSKDLSRSVKLTGHQGPVIHLALNEQKGILASASFDKSIKLWNADTGKYIKSLRGHANAVYMICWSLDGRYLASISKDSTVKIWDCDGQLTKELAGHKDEVLRFHIT